MNQANWMRACIYYNSPKVEVFGKFRDIVLRILDDDPDESRPENRILWNRLRELRKTNVNWSAIS